jgi:hypothetical protein
MQDARNISMTSLPGISPEQARDVRARALIYVFQCWQEKQNAAGVASTNGDDATVKNNKEVSNVNGRTG